MTEHYLIFKTKDGGNYLYDTATNSVHPWYPHLEEDFVTKLYETTDEELEDKLIWHEGFQNEQLLFYLRLWRVKTGAFRSSNLLPSLSFQELSDVPIEKKGPVWKSDLVLISSEKCNLRCAYCSYASFYSGYRTHSNKLMSYNVAQKAIDWFYRYNDDAVFHGYPDRNLNIVFYGGESLINFELVHRSIVYAEKSKRDHYGLVLSVSTNLTLLKEEHLSFLRDHNVYLNVSLDGPPEEHDRYRRFKNGLPTFEKVLSNLKRIKRFDENYYFSRVRILPTINGNSDVLSVYEYFEENKSELPPLLTVNLLKDLSFSEFHRVYPYDASLFNQKRSEVLNRYIKQKMQGKHFAKGSFLYHFIEESLNNIYQRVQSYGSAVPPWYTGTCLPGRKIAVSPDGKFHICERINEHFPIGDVNRGLDEEKIIEVLNKYFKNLPSCHKCWARNLCVICIAAVCDKEHFDFEHRCQSMRKALKSNLSLLFSILEKRQDAFYSKDKIINRMPNLSKIETVQ